VESVNSTVRKVFMDEFRKLGGSEHDRILRIGIQYLLEVEGKHKVLKEENVKLMEDLVRMELSIISLGESVRKTETIRMQRCGKAGSCDMWEPLPHDVNVKHGVGVEKKSVESFWKRLLRGFK
jgi:hypothetical protein